ncbi:Chaperonin-like RBCX protein 1 [Citrus sinensis]|uniref:Chaperonin-like RBCX protein 1 n=1 Tax=Citrus sinensis TaxID=2711 RepID=A0ACB8NK79_CITSI|nr:Chaperonin-like RBCX protein 1 [Citrus sinensis]
MDTSSILPLPQLSFLSLRLNRNKASWPCNLQRSPRSTGFGEASPEAKGAKHLHNFFTYIAVRIITAQLQSYNPEAYKELMEFLERHPLNDGDKFCADLMRESSRHKGLALRILEVRSAYCKRDFEWDNLKRLAIKTVDESNTRLMRDYVLETSHVEKEK